VARLLKGNLIAAVLLLALANGCAGKKAADRVDLSEIQGKKVALISIEGGEASARSIIETALVNQLMQRGTFILVSKQDVAEARRAPDQNPTDWKGIARRAGADYALKARILDFTADTQGGYSSETVEDSQLKAETGNGKTEQIYKVRRITGHVLVALDFARAAGGHASSGTAEATDQATAGSRTESATLPPKLRFLEKVANNAFQKFFQTNF
jgi:hypothetical protein